MPPFTFVCPACQGPLKSPSADTRYCPTDKETYTCVDGIWRFLPSWRAWNFDRFIKRYEYILEEERWGSIDRRHYLDLPRCHPGHPHVREWRAKAVDYHLLLQQVVNPLSKHVGTPLNIIDAGAGNGWLTNRLGELGHNVAAVDISAHCRTGLGARTHYDHDLFCVQAEFNHIPFIDNSADLVVFCDSLHYSTDYEVTLREALRVLRPHGLIAVMASPLFRKVEGGYMMVNVIEDYHMRRFGYMLDSLSFEHFLTRNRLANIGETLNADVKYRWAQGLPARLVKRAQNFLPAARLRVHIHPDAYVQQIIREERNVKQLFGQMFEIERRWRWRRPEQPQFPLVILQRGTS